MTRGTVREDGGELERGGGSMVGMSLARDRAGVHPGCRDGRLTIEMYERMLNTGQIREGAPIELLGGGDGAQGPRGEEWESDDDRAPAYVCSGGVDGAGG